MKLSAWMKRERLDDEAVAQLSKRRTRTGICARTVRTARKGGSISLKRAAVLVKTSRREVGLEDLVRWTEV